MYQRIKSASDVQQLHPGTLLIRYPLSGQATEEIDLSATDDFDLYEVESIEDDTVRLLLRADIEGMQVPGDEPTIDDAAHALSTFIIKQTSALLQEENWWHNEELISG